MLGTIIVGLLLTAAVFAALRQIRKGKMGACANCTGCCAVCHTQKKPPGCHKP